MLKSRMPIPCKAIAEAPAFLQSVLVKGSWVSVMYFAGDTRTLLQSFVSSLWWASVICSNHRKWKQSQKVRLKHPLVFQLNNWKIIHFATIIWGEQNRVDIWQLPYFCFLEITFKIQLWNNNSDTRRRPGLRGTGRRWQKLQ